MKFRHECKHRINLADVIRLRTRLSAAAEHDPHCGADGSYFIKSLYFDNYNDKVLREKEDGVRRREKFRIRYYDNDTSFMRLKKKTKLNNLSSKESAPVTAEECRRIIEGDTGFMLDSPHELMRELYAKMNYQLLRPKWIVAYDRECFVYPQGNVRVTLDMGIRGSNAVERFTEPSDDFVSQYHTPILEVKWDEFLPQFIRDIVGLDGRRTSSFSKYAAVRI